VALTVYVYSILFPIIALLESKPYMVDWPWLAASCPPRRSLTPSPQQNSGRRSD